MALDEKGMVLEVIRIYPLGNMNTFLAETFYRNLPSLHVQSKYHV